MAFFDIGINVNVNLGNSIASISQLQATMRGLPSSAQTGATAVQQLSNSISTSTLSASRAIPIYSSLGARVQQMGQQFSATTAPMQQLVTGVNQLGITTQNTFQRIGQSGNALANLNSQLGQTSTQFVNAERSGNRLAEIFRGNRGLVFGASALFGTLTGIAFELQLVSDANTQVSDSQARVNTLMAQGKEGTGEMSQAMQALGKDQRFLEFSSRNLALAFTNLIPDVLLIANGILSLGQRLSTARAPMAEVGAVAAVTAVEIRTVGVASATSATPLGALGVGGRLAGVGLTQAGIGARFFGISLRAALIGTGIGAALVLIGLALEPIIEGFIKTREAAAGLETTFDKTGTSIAGVTGNFNAVIESADAMKNGITSSSDDMASDFSEATKHMIDDATALATKLGKLPAEIELQTLNIQKGALENEKKALQDKMASPLGLQSLGDVLSGKAGVFTPKGGTEAQKKELSDLGVKIDTVKTKAASLSAAIQTAKQDVGKGATLETQQLQIQLNALDAASTKVAPFVGNVLRALGPKIAGTDPESPLFKARVGEGRKMIESKFPTPGPEQTAALMQYDFAVEQVGEDMKNSSNSGEHFKDVQEALKKSYEDSQRQLDAYNSTVDQYPKILQDTGVMVKQLSDKEAERILIIRDSAAAFVGQALAYQLSIGVAEKVAEVGNQITGGLIEQRDTIAATNLVWNNMGTVVQGTTQTLGQWILAQQETIAGSIDMTRAITNQTYQQYLVNQGLIAGKLAVQQWVDSLYQSTAAEETEQQMLEAIVGTYMKLSPALTLTTQDLKALGEEMARTGDNAATMDAIMNKTFASSRAALSDLVGKAVEGGKAWKDAWKDLDKSFIPKGEFGEVKDFINDLGDIQEAAQKVAPALGAFMGMLEAGRISGKENAAWTKELTEGMRGMRDALGEIVGMNVAESIFDPLIKFKKDGLTQNEVQIWAAVANKYKELSEMPGIWTDERTRQLQQYTNKLLEQKKAYDELQKSADKAEKSVKNVHSITVLGSGSGVQVKPDHPLTEKEYEQQVKELKKKGVFNLIPRPDDPKTDKKSTDKLVEDLEKRVPAAAQKAQTALKNMSVQGANSISILEKAAAAHTKSLNTFFGTTVPVAAQKTQTSLANMGIQGSASIALLTISSITLAKTIIIVATDVLAWVATNNVLARTLLVVEKDVQAVIKANNTLARTIVTVGKDFASGADDAADFASGLKAVASAADKATSALKKLKAAGGGAVSAQGGFHTNRLEEDTVIFAHQDESVHIGPGSAEPVKARRSSGDATIVINLTNVTENILDGQVIGTTVNKKTFRGIKTR